MSTIDVGAEVITMDEDAVVLRLPYRELLVQTAGLERFDDLEEWLPWAILHHAIWVAIRTKADRRLIAGLAQAINERWPNRNEWDE